MRLQKKSEAKSQSQPVKGKREARAARHARRQAMRAEAQQGALERGDMAEFARLDQLIRAAERGHGRAGVGAAGRKERLGGLGNDRAAAMADIAARVARKRKIGPASEAFTLAWPEKCGERDGAALVGGCASVLLEAGDARSGGRLVDLFSSAAQFAAKGDHRCRPLREAIISAPADEDPNCAVERAMLFLATAGQSDALWALVRHEGAGTAQGPHHHLVWIHEDDGPTSSHGFAHLAAQIWALEHGGEAMPPSLACGPAGMRDWANAFTVAPDNLKNRVVEFSGRGLPGGLWIAKGGARLEDTKSRIAHALGLD